MKGTVCPSFENCQLVFDKNIVKDKEVRNNYIIQYCKSKNHSWYNCKRFMTKQKLNFCPDFVLPDSKHSPDEIIDKYDNENID